jgi:hypothetical protein
MVTPTRARRLFQSMRNRSNKRLRKNRRAARQRGLPSLLHWPDPQQAAGAAGPLDELRAAGNTTRAAPVHKESGFSVAIRSLQSLADLVAASRPSARSVLLRQRSGRPALECIWIQSYAFVSANLHEQPLRTLRRGAKANHLLSRRGNSGNDCSGRV